MNLPSLPPQKPPGALSTHVEARKEPINRALASFAETGLITPDQQRSLSVAATNLAVMKAVTTPSAQRHFGRIDTMLTVRTATPVSEARESLAGLAKVWDGLDIDFHKYRTLFFQTRLIRAQMKKRTSEIAAMPESDDRDIAAAQLDLDGAQLQGMEVELAKGHAKLTGELKKATDYSEQYKLICKAAGKEADGFTEEDFRKEEIDYYIKSAFWHASQVAETIDTRDKHDRKPGQRMPWESERGHDFKEQLKARKAMQILVPKEAELCFQLMGISPEEVKQEIAKLEEQRFNFNLSHPTGVHSFSDHFDSWLLRTVEKYRARVAGQLGLGSDKFKRLQSLLNPDDADGGGRGDVGKIERRSMIQ